MTEVLGYVVCQAPVMVIQLIHLFAESRFNLLKKSILKSLLMDSNRQFRKEYIDLLQVTCPSSIQFTPVVTQSQWLRYVSNVSNEMYILSINEKIKGTSESARVCDGRQILCLIVLCTICGWSLKKTICIFLTSHLHTSNCQLYF